MDNAQQIEFWNGPGGQKWAQLNDSTERMLSYITAALMPFAAVKAGERVLDIGCGCGTTSFAHAKSVGSTGSVTGVDISKPMLEVARKSAAGAANISFIEADASAHAFKPEYDVVFSRFGVMFFADPRAAFANIRKALKPGGRVAFVCWRSLQENAWAARPLALAMDLLPPQEAADTTAPGPFAFADSARVTSILTGTGFKDVKLETLDTVSGMGATAEEAAQASLNMGLLSRAAGSLDDRTKAQIQIRVRNALAEFQTQAGITPPAACWLVSAKN
jgi:SAM-dependent methyltransferase